MSEEQRSMIELFEASAELDVIGQSFQGFISHASLLKLDSLQQTLISTACDWDKGEGSMFIEVKQPLDDLNDNDPCSWLMSRAFSPAELSEKPLEDQMELARYYDVIVELNIKRPVKAWWRVKLINDTQLQSLLISQWLENDLGHIALAETEAEITIHTFTELVPSAS